jgi:hypothetical protein
MSDQELAAYLGIDGDPNWPKFVGNMDPKARSAYERMREVEFDIKLWQAGVGPKPTGVILCHDHSRDRGAKR